MFAVMELSIINIIRVGKHDTAGKLAQHQLKYTVEVALYRMFRLVKGTNRVELPDKFLSPYWLSVQSSQELNPILSFHQSPQKML